MPLDWTFTFLFTTPEIMHRPRILLILSFRDGKLNILSTPYENKVFVEQMEKMLNLISYLAFFPQKNFTKIQLKTPQNAHAVHYLDKRFIEKRNFLGVLSVNEHDDESPYKYWGMEEIMGNNLFENFLDRFKELGKIANQEIDFSEFKNWACEQIVNFYDDWASCKMKGINYSTEKLILEVQTDESNEAVFEHWWDIQLINEAGLPVTHVLSFLEKQSFYYMDETENVTQNITSMSISALKYVIDEHGGDWNIDYLKSKLNNEMGYQYTFFKKFSVVKESKLLNFMLIMNSGLFNLDNQVYVQVIKGKELDLLEKFAVSLKRNPQLFSPEAVLCNFDSDQDKVHNILLSCVEEIF